MTKAWLLRIYAKGVLEIVESYYDAGMATYRFLAFKKEGYQAELFQIRADGILDLFRR